jgi:imidazolonepropionase-like amidohydrolase
MRFFFILYFFIQTVTAQNLLITNVAVIPVATPTILTNVNVYITDGIIDKIVPGGTKLPFKEYQTVDGKGKYLIPGLADMHAHFPDEKSPIQIQEYLQLNLSAGITTLRNMRGEESHLHLRDSIQKKQKIGPEISVSYVFPENDSTLTKEKIAELIFNAKIKKFDFVKYLGGLKPKKMEALSQACYEYKIPLAGHAYNNSLAESVNYDFVSVEHFQPILNAFKGDTVTGNKLIKLLNDKNVALCPTLSFYHVFSFGYSEAELMERNGMSRIRQATKDAWLKEYHEAMNSAKEQLKDGFETNYVNAYKNKFNEFNRILKMLNDKHVLILMSADDGAFNVPGFALTEEMKLYHSAGLSNYEIIKCATLNAAIHLKNDKTNGTIEQGKKANMVLLNANPLENIENITKVEATILNGKCYFQKRNSEKSK